MQIPPEFFIALAFIIIVLLLIGIHWLPSDGRHVAPGWDELPPRPDPPPAPPKANTGTHTHTIPKPKCPHCPQAVYEVEHGGKVYRLYEDEVPVTDEYFKKEE
jgi:hypothetical protein